MNVFTMVVAIVALGTLSSVLVRWMKLREKELEAKTAGSDAKDSKITELEERIKVLERIVTDKSHNLSEEISAL